MKNNTQNSKELLFKALHSLPEDFALKEAKQQIVRAINEIEKIEGRRAQREQNLKIQEKEKKVFVSPYTASQQLQEIENMINTEKKKLEALQEKKKNKNDEDEDLQTIHN